RVCPALRPVRADQVAAGRARQLEEHRHGLRKAGAEGQVLDRILERRQVGLEPGVLPILEFGVVRAVTRDQPREQVVARVFRRQLGARRREIVALHQISVGIGRAKRLGLGLDALHAYDRSRLVEQRDDLGKLAPRARAPGTPRRHPPVHLQASRIPRPGVPKRCKWRTWWVLHWWSRRTRSLPCGALLNNSPGATCLPLASVARIKPSYPTGRRWARL